MIHFEYYKYTASSAISKSVKINFQKKKSSPAKNRTLGNSLAIQNL